MTKSVSTWLELGNPRPKQQPTPYTPIEWTGQRIELSIKGSARAPHLAALLAARRSRRDFAAPATLDDLAAILELCCRTREVQASDLGFDLEFRPHPAAGAIHSVHTLVQRENDENWMYYDAQAHQLVSLPGTAAAANAARSAADELVPAANASLIALVAEPNKAAAKYKSPESLIWRDAGVLLGYFSICAEALNLSFCPLGITGQPMLDRELDEQGRLCGVGMALLGRTHPG